MAKQSLRWSPLGPFMAMAGTVFIDRSNNGSAVQSLKVAGEGMKARGTSLWIFAEGTRTSQEIPNMRPLKKGGFYLAVQNGIPIVPVVFENYWRFYHHGVFNSGVMKVRVLPAVPTEGLTPEDIPALSDRVHDQMLIALREISVQVSPEELEKSVKASAVTAAEPFIPAPSSVVEVETTTPVPEDASDSISNISEEQRILSEDSVSTSTTSSTPSGRQEGSEWGAETEEDEGMVLVGRPT